MSSIPKLLKLKDYVTLTGTTLGILALICAIQGDRFFISLGYFLIVITIGTDMLDGLIAKKTGTANEIGKELDSLSDSLTFGIAPAVLAYQAYKTGSPYDILLIIGAICFALGAVLRLARFNISTDIPGYVGVPTPLSALLLIVFFYFNYFFAFAFGGGGVIGLIEPFPAISYYAIPFIMIFAAYANITTYIEFGEKGKIIYEIFIVLAGLTVVLAIIGISNPSFILSVIVGIFFLCSFLTELGYFIIGFFIKLRATQKRIKKEG